jgi:hypothetical protein
MLKELEQLGMGDPTPLFNGLTSTASALAALMPKEDEMQQMKSILNPPDMLRAEKEQTQEQDNYVNPDLAPRPGR